MEYYSAKVRYKRDAAVHYNEKRKGNSRNLRRWNSELSCVSKIMNKIPKDSLVLDIPCGTGRFFPVLLRHGCNIVGIDVSEDMILQIPQNVLSGNDKISVHTGDAESLDYPSLHFDYVLCMRFFNIVPDKVRQNALREFARVASKGIFIEVRFRGYNSFLFYLGQLVKRFIQKTKGVIKQAVVADSQATASVHEENRRPSLKEFRSLVQSLGLRLVRIDKVDWGFTLNPMTICHLERSSHMLEK